MKVKVLASGSKGNSTLVQTDSFSFLIDLGITYQSLAYELEKVNLTPQDISFVFLTHTHSDHIKGLASFLKKTNAKVYILEEMAKELARKIPSDSFLYYQNSFSIGDLSIQLIRISHDVEGVGFILEENHHSCVYITDTGYINERYFPFMKNKEVYIIESNHDEEMLMNGDYPYLLKQRVISDRGHLSNSTTAGYLLKLVGDKTQCIVLAHISENNNTEELAFHTTHDLLEANQIFKRILVAKQYESLEEIEV